MPLTPSASALTPLSNTTQVECCFFLDMSEHVHTTCVLKKRMFSFIGLYKMSQNQREKIVQNTASILRIVLTTLLQRRDSALET